jgi:GABA permease
MRIPVKSERDAFLLAYGTAAVLAAAVALGVLAGALYGFVLVAGAVIGALIWELRTRDADRPQPAREAAEAAPSGDGVRHRVLVVANETVGGRELREEIMSRAARTPEIRVVCPILPSRAHLVTSDIDHELGEARARLDQTLAWAAEHGIAATGSVSADTPLMAAADELRRFAADEVIVSTHPQARSRWLESGLVERLREELDIPVHHVVVDLQRVGEPAR